MKITVIMVSTVNGKITYDENPNIYLWTSEEDQKHFTETLLHARLIIMGRKTYEIAKKQMKHIPDRLRVVLTHNPQIYKSEDIPGQLEFTNETPEQLVRRLESLGYSAGMVVGGREINSMFFMSNLVNELWLTIEPTVFGRGKEILSEIDLQVRLQLISTEKLNDQGTLLLKYKVS
ncbi:MAG: dihydrofolate reductase [Patescibacteria group bacterium]|nr:dihydrofolate reductase [Patescibacteria group bacterium]